MRRHRSNAPRDNGAIHHTMPTVDSVWSYQCECDLAAFLAVLCLLLGGLAFAQHEAMASAKERAARCEVRP